MLQWLIKGRGNFVVPTFPDIFTEIDSFQQEASLIARGLTQRMQIDMEFKLKVIHQDQKNLEGAQCKDSWWL